jgi:hypothetical protein
MGLMTETGLVRPQSPPPRFMPLLGMSELLVDGAPVYEEPWF